MVFQPLTASTAMRTLHNPRYAGVYAYGQRLYRRTIDGKKQLRKRDPKEWLACIPDAHPGYISWDQYQHNLKVLQVNGRSYNIVRASPPREGAALFTRARDMRTLRQPYESPLRRPTRTGG